MVRMTWIVALAFSLQKLQLAFTETPWQTKITFKYEFSFYDYAINNIVPAQNANEAKALCESNVGVLVKMEDPEVRRIVAETIKSARKVTYFWIGAKRIRNSDNWQWFDKTAVQPSLLQWYDGQPDNVEGTEDYLVIRKSDAKYGDISFSYSYAGTICQRLRVCAHSVQTTGLEVGETSEMEIICTAQGIPAPTVVWKMGNREISTSSLKNLHQVKSTSQANLLVQNAKVTDEREYTCVATNTVDGNPCETTAKAQLTIPSKPVIVSVEPHYCNSSLTVEWRPHARAVGVKHWIRVLQENKSIHEQEVQITPNDTSKLIFLTKNLNSSVLYHVTITVCKSCRHPYSDSRKNYTLGLPRRVESPVLKQVNGSCEVNWTWPKNTPHSFINGFQVKMTYVTARVSFANEAPSVIYAKEISTNLSYSIPKRPNRNHTVSISSRTCAGFSEAVIAEGTCITDVAAPDSIDKPVLELDEVSQNGLMNFSTPAPSEINGPISCIFVIVQIGNSSPFTVVNEIELAKVNSSDVEDTYIAVASEKRRILFGLRLSITLGNGSTTACNIRTGSKRNTKTAVDDMLYVGHNKALSNKDVYKIYIVTSTPSDTGNVFFGVSEYLQVTSRENHVDTVSATLYVVVATVLLLLVAACSIVAVFMFKRKQKAYTGEGAEPNNTYEYPTIPIGLANEAGYENVGIQMTAGSVAPGRSQSETAYETFNVNEQAVQQTPSLYPGRGKCQTSNPVYEIIK